MNASNIQFKNFRPMPFIGAIIEQNHRLRRERFVRSFKFNGIVGQSYQIQATTNFINWVTLTNLICTNSPTSCALGGQTVPRSFYRVVKP